MANTDTTLTALVKTGYERTAQFSLRSALYFDSVAHVRPSNITNPGLTLTWTFLSDYAAQTTALTEGVDPTPLATSTSTVSITLNEYGATSTTTAKLRGSTFLQPAVDPQVANILGYNAGLTVDTLARNVLVAGTNVSYMSATQTRVSISSANTMTAARGRYAVAKLRGGNARGFGDMGIGSDSYVAFIHPDISYDLMSETGADSWTQPSNYSAVDQRWNGTIGKLGGAVYLETPRAPIFVDAGTPGTVDVYATIYVGKEALAKAYSANVSSPLPQTVMGPQVDTLRRNNTIGWYWFGGYAMFRQEECYRVESASSIGTN